MTFVTGAGFYDLIFGLNNVTKAVKALDQDEVTLKNVEGFRGPSMNLVTEAGLKQ